MQKHTHGDFGVLETVSVKKPVAIKLPANDEFIATPGFWADLRLVSNLSNKEFAKNVAGEMIRELMEGMFAGGVVCTMALDQMHRYIEQLNYLLKAKGFEQSLGTLIIEVSMDLHEVSIEWALEYLKKEK